MTEGDISVKLEHNNAGAAYGHNAAKKVDASTKMHMNMSMWGCIEGSLSD